MIMRNLLIRKTRLFTVIGFSAYLVLTAFSTATLSLGPLGFSLLFSHEAVAAKEKRRKPPTRRSQSLSQKVYKKIEKAQNAIEAKEFTKAKNVLDALKARYEKLNDFEKATLWNFYASLAYNLDDIPAVARAYKSLLSVPNLSPALEQSTLYGLGQIYFSQEKYRESMRILNIWLTKVEKPSPQVYLIIATGHYQLKEYRPAIPLVNKAIELTRSRNKAVKKNTYSLLKALYLEIEDYKNAKITIKEMVLLFDDPRDWSLLAAIYGQLNQEKAQLQTYDAAYSKGYLNKGYQLISLASLLLANDVPYKAARIVEKGMKDGVIEETDKNLGLLAQCWQIAREDKKVIKPLKRAAKMSKKSGDLYYRLGQAYLNIYKYQLAANAFKQAIKKGKLKREGQVLISMGLAYFNLKKFDDSLAAFKQAKKFKKTRKTARNWEKYVISEKSRDAELTTKKRQLGLL